MLRGFKALDRVLRGDATRLRALREGTIDIPSGSLLVVLVVLVELIDVFRSAESPPADP